MTNREIYDAALALLAEEQDELNEDYASRAPFILSMFFCECREANAFYRTARGQMTRDGDALGVMPDLDDEFPLSERFFTAGVFYMAAMLVEIENDALCDRLFAHYAHAISTITGRGAPARPESIRDVYGFSLCE